GLHPGPDLDTYAAAALAGLPVRAAGRLLDDLVDAHLLQEPVAGRYRFHDLLRAHARTLSTSDTSAAVARLFDHYTSCASVAMDLAYPFDAAQRPRTRRPGVPAFADRAYAATWLDTELTNLLAVATHGEPAHSVHLSATLHRHLHTRAHHQQA